MKQTPAHLIHNRELLSLMPSNAKRIVEVGCMLGALANAYRVNNPNTEYTGIDIDADYAKQAQAYCTDSFAADIETLDESRWAKLFPSDCWVFGDTLEHLRDPWAILHKIRANIAPNGCVVVCIPNAQHWSVQMRLATGLFRYEDSGLLDRTHLRWFTRVTIAELFEATGFQVTDGITRHLTTPAPNGLLDAIAAAVASTGATAPVISQARQDAQVFQYVFKAIAK